MVMPVATPMAKLMPNNRPQKRVMRFQISRPVITYTASMITRIMEAVYVMTGREIWKRMTRFWGLLFGINFAMGVATVITMEFQFGTNWAYYSHYAGDILGAPLALEGLVAFFLEASFVGLFFFGWERLSRVGHLVVTALVALGSI